MESYISDLNMIIPTVTQIRDQISAMNDLGFGEFWTIVIDNNGLKNLMYVGEKQRDWFEKTWD